MERSSFYLIKMKIKPFNFEKLFHALEESLDFESYHHYKELYFLIMMRNGALKIFMSLLNVITLLILKRNILINSFTIST